MNVASIASGGMRGALSKFERASSGIARSVSDEEDAPALEEALVAQAEADAEFRANAALVRVADDMMALLLDIQADEKR